MDQIGRSWPIRLAVEAGKVSEFARAVGVDPSRTSVPLPTFPAVLNHYGTTTSDAMVEMGYVLTRVLHGEERIRYPNGPLRVGEELSGEIRLADLTRKTGRSGPLEFLSFVLHLRRPDHSVAVEIERTLVVIG
jgi:hypothetical protein